MKFNLKGVIILTLLMALNHFTYSQNSNLKTIAPNMPETPEGKLMDHPEYLTKMDEWVAKFPEEFKKAVKIDASLNVFAPPFEGQSTGNLRPLTEPPPTHNPSFMNYPVKETKPVFIDNKNPDYDSLVYERKLQHWYFKFDKNEYVKKYGTLPKIIDDSKIITHPSQLNPAAGPDEYYIYYPEFKED